MSQSSQNSPLPGKPVQSYFQWLYAFWKFSRPHTIIGTSLSVLGLYLIAIAISRDAINHISTDAMNRVSTNAMNHVSTYSLLPVFGAWIGCLCGNVYIVGLNQLEDVEIDKINKPHLPLASGEFSQQTGQLIVASTGILALVVAWLTGPFLFGMVAISLAIGTAYSLPPIRLKQFPVWAALCIFSVRGTIVNLGLYLHYSWALQQSQTIPPVVWVLTLFILVFTFAIAIFKDIPDMEGDRLYNITTFTIKLGPQAVFNLSLWVITACYLGIILVGVLNVASVNAIFLVVTHLGLLAWLWLRSLTVDLQDKSAIAQFYQFIWKLFFMEYLIFPIACLLA
ncbi:homogentisate phytyltransferase [Nostoc sp. 'Peltigera malacea cyanobiont' DB3992]|uniref:homogentisate phytyltransferase n=1 Tax=Nostoc sp. 'Peltigera malacea cyanobiont' DB3992 TaxID=1206980 RepID=UPI000C0475BE|nr:homogentisate phytyltransferase [Nostoc sp. 'Peltigera malacea cyanobiont' DB3992]PHM07238.1 homogentisate phytyltransferase [Nostoc sp. 'Peltigera malacea cyanobiont' DB3992]